MVFSKVGVIGLGRFGRYWGKVLGENSVSPLEVFGASRKIYDDLPSVIKQVPLEEVCRLPLVFLSVPISSMPEMLQKISPLLGKDTVVADTCSVKVYPVLWMKKYLPEDTPILATHPMFGPESGKFSVKGLAIMMSNIRMSDEDFNWWKSFFTGMGMEVSEMSPVEHDRQAAYSQALTHLVGRTLNTLGMKETRIATRWYQDLLGICRQVARDSQELFDDMENLNPFAVSMRHSYEEAYSRVLRELDETCPSFPDLREELEGLVPGDILGGDS